MPRPFRQQVDEEILDHAAALFARHGFAQTSLKSLADAVGLSKAGLLHHYPSKEALYEAALQVGHAQAQQVLDRLEPATHGPERDRRALELLADIALDRPGLVALAFSSFTASDAVPVFDARDVVFSKMFGVDPADSRSDRLVRVMGALAALAALSLLANQQGDKTTWRPLIIATCFDALGHPRPDTSSSRSHQVEA